MKNNQTKTHAFIQVGKDIKAGEIPSLVLLYGSEEFLVHFYSDALIAKYVSKASEALDLVTLDREHVTADSIIENMETMPLMSERKVVYLPDFIDANSKLPKSFADSQAEMDKLLEYMTGLEKVDGVLLMMTFANQEDSRAEENIRKTKLFKLINTGGNVYDFGMLDHDQLRAFIEKRFHAGGKQFRPGIVSLIVREAGYGNKNIDYGLYDLDNDLRKIIAYCGESTEITPADVSAVITVNPENNVFAMIDAIGRNRKDEAFKLLQNLLQDGSSELQLLGMITKQLEIMLQSCEMKGTGMNLSMIQKELKKKGIHEYRTQKALEAGNRFGIHELKRILSSAYEVEINIKSGLMPGQLALEYFVAGI